MSMVNSIRSDLEAIIREDGPWTAHYFELPGGIETMPGQFSTWTSNRAMFSLRCAQLALGKPASSIRALDLGCLEGGIAIALAQAGCEVIGLEIREQSVRKARFAANALDVQRVTFVQGDMLRLADFNLGNFDLIVCAGTLYHVDAPDLLHFMQSLNASCQGITVFDTHVSMEPNEQYSPVPGLEVVGKSIVEHAPSEQACKSEKLWASAENNHSFWPTERSLANLAIAAGFAQITRPLAPIPEWKWQDRAFWVAYSSAHAAAVGAVPYYGTQYLPDPDRREAMCPTINLQVNDQCPNPNTTRLK